MQILLVFCDNIKQGDEKIVFYLRKRNYELLENGMEIVVMIVWNVNEMCGFGAPPSPIAYCPYLLLLQALLKYISTKIQTKILEKILRNPRKY